MREIRRAACTEPRVRTGFHVGLSLTFDTHRGVRKNLQSSKRDRLVATVTIPVDTLAYPFKSFIDSTQFATLDFGELAADFIVGSFHGNIHYIATFIRKFAQQAQVTSQRHSQCLAAANQHFSQLFQSLFSSGGYWFLFAFCHFVTLSAELYLLSMGRFRPNGKIVRTYPSPSSLCEP